jgi:hypothetical protein
MTNDTATTVISWTPEKVERLDKQLKEADHGEATIVFDGHAIYVPYGIYLVDYLKSRFNV